MYYSLILNVISKERDISIAIIYKMFVPLIRIESAMNVSILTELEMKDWRYDYYC